MRTSLPVASGSASIESAATSCARTTSKSEANQPHMPTGRELLEQGEAMMQRDRAAMLGDGIPTLTDSVATPGGVVPELDGRRAPTALDGIPMLTETVEDFDTASIPLA